MGEPGGFLIKTVFGLPATRSLIDRLHHDRALRQPCGALNRGEVPSEATSSRAYTEFAEDDPTYGVHHAHIIRVFDNHLAGHLSRDSKAIEAREKAAKPDRSFAGRHRRGILQ